MSLIGVPTSGNTSSAVWRKNVVGPTGKRNIWNVSCHSFSPTSPFLKKCTALRCESQRNRKFKVRASDTDIFSPLKPLLEIEPKPVFEKVETFAPATVANLGVGFDFLGCAVTGLGDYVIAEISPDTPPGTVSIKSISGDGGKLSLSAPKNCAGIAGQATLDLLGVKSVGVSLILKKGLPLGSGLGSSAASAAAGAVAVNALFGSPLTKRQLIEPGLRSEATVSGYHADNVAPSLLGGFVLIRSYDPLEIFEISFEKTKELYFVLASPEFEAPTEKMRKVLPKEISVKVHLHNSSQAASLMTGILTGDIPLLGSSLGSDLYAEPLRGDLIPGFHAVKAAANLAGAYGCTISGAGPTSVAITDSAEKAEKISEAMVKAFSEAGGLKAVGYIQKLDAEGARVIES